MQSGGDPIARLWQVRTFFNSWQDSSAVNRSEDQTTNPPDGSNEHACWKRLNEGRPYVMGTLTEARIAEIARQLGMDVAWVRTQAAEQHGEEALKRMMQTRNGGGGCGGGGRSFPDIGSRAASGNAESGQGGADIAMFGVLVLVAGRIIMQVVTAEAAAASMLLGLAFPPPPEA